MFFCIICCLLFLSVQSERIGKLVPGQVQEIYGKEKLEYIDMAPSQLPKFGDFSTMLFKFDNDVIWENKDYKLSFSFEHFKFTTPLIKAFKSNNLILSQVDFRFKHDENDIIKLKCSPHYKVYNPDMNPKESEWNLMLHYHWTMVSAKETRSSLAVIYLICCLCVIIGTLVVTLTFIQLEGWERK